MAFRNKNYTCLLTTRPQKAKLKFLIYYKKKNFFPERGVRSRQSHPPVYAPDKKFIIARQYFL